MRPVSLCLAGLLASVLLAGADPKVKIASVPAEYTPPLSFYSKPVWVAGHHFEVDPATGRVRLVVEYEFPFQSLEAYKYGGLGPDDTEVEVPGLTWDAASRQVIYESGGARTVCAEASPHSEKIKLKNTRSCKVIGTVRDRTAADSPSIQTPKVLDVWLETD